MLFFQGVGRNVKRLKYLQLCTLQAFIIYLLLFIEIIIRSLHFINCGI